MNSMLRFSAASLVVLAACAWIGCGDSVDEASGAEPAAPGSPSDEHAPQPELRFATPITLGFGPLAVPAGVERTQCVTKRLGNAGEFRVGRIHNQLIGASHHLIIYRVKDSQERPEPYDCEPFADTLSAQNGAPLMITQKHEELLQLPKGLAFVLEPDQMIRLEMHYINTSAQEQMIEGVARFEPLADSEFEHAVGFLFAGDLDVLLPPGQATQLSAFIEAPLELYDKQFFGFTGHTHKLGTNVLVEMGGRTGDDMQPVYQVDSFDWAEPPTIIHDPPRVLPPDGRFRLTCDYVNGGDSAVRFGESAHDEMCFFWGYYFPSAGSHVCFHTKRSGLDINNCCPGGPFCR